MRVIPYASINYAAHETLSRVRRQGGWKPRALFSCCAAARGASPAPVPPGAPGGPAGRAPRRSPRAHALRRPAPAQPLTRVRPALALLSAVAHRRGRNAAQPAAQVRGRRADGHDQHHLHVRGRPRAAPTRRCEPAACRAVAVALSLTRAVRRAATRLTWRGRAWRWRPRGWRRTWCPSFWRWHVALAPASRPALLPANPAAGCTRAATEREAARTAARRTLCKRPAAACALGARWRQTLAVQSVALSDAGTDSSRSLPAVGGPAQVRRFLCGADADARRDHPLLGALLGRSGVATHAAHAVPRRVPRGRRTRR